MHYILQEKEKTTDTAVKAHDVARIDRTSMTAYINGIKMDGNYMNLRSQGKTHNDTILGSWLKLYFKLSQFFVYATFEKPRSSVYFISQGTI